MQHGNPIGVLVVFAAKTVQQMLELLEDQVFGHSSAKYVECPLCCLHSKLGSSSGHECGPRPEPHNAASWSERCRG